MSQLKQKIAQRQEEEKRERRERILTAARTVFFEKGFLNATMRDIALEAALSPGLIYHYFQGKDDLYGEICREAFMNLIRDLDQAARDGSDARQRLTAVARAYVDFYLDNPEYFDLISFRDLGFKKVDLSATIRRKLDDLSLTALGIVKKLVEEGIRDGSIRRLGGIWEMTMGVWSPLEGLIFIHKRGYLDNFNIDIKALLDMEFSALFGGLID